MQQDQPVSVAAWIDGVNSSRASTIEGYVQGAHGMFVADRMIREGQVAAAPLMTIEPRYRYIPGFESLPSMAPSVPAILLMLFPAILMANWVILTAMAGLLFRVPLQGSAMARALGAIAYIFAATGFPGMYIESSGAGEAINNTAVTFVDEDRSSLSRALQTALYPPYFLPPNEAGPDQVEQMLDWGETNFVVVVSAGFEADVRAGRTPTLQVNIDATRTMQASVGPGYLTAIMSAEVQRCAARADLAATDHLPAVLAALHGIGPGHHHSHTTCKHMKPWPSEDHSHSIIN